MVFSGDARLQEDNTLVRQGDGITTPNVRIDYDYLSSM